MDSGIVFNQMFSSLSNLWSIAAIFFVLLIAGAFVKGVGNRKQTFQYARKEYLFTAAEKSFLHVLELAVNNNRDRFI